jgi:siroheme synthase
MPGSNMTLLQGRLLNSGVSPTTPCAIISGATSESEQVHITTVADLIGSPPMAAPKLLVIGEVVRLASPNHLRQQSREFAFSRDLVEVSPSNTSTTMESAE